MAAKRGRFVWYDLMTTDVEGARAFYSEVVGWTPKAWAEGDYVVWNVGETGVGGLMKLPEDAVAMGAPAYWMGYVGVEDVAAACEDATKLGGKVYKEPTEIPKVGTFAVIGDPQGAALALFHPLEGDMSAPDVSGPGTFVWRELCTSDWKSAWKFYSELFGWKHTSDFEMGEMGTYSMFAVGGSDEELGGMFDLSDRPPYWRYYIHVDDIDAALERVESHGGKVVLGPTEIPGGGRVAQCLDPQGVAFSLHWAKA